MVNHCLDRMTTTTTRVRVARTYQPIVYTDSDNDQFNMV